MIFFLKKIKENLFLYTKDVIDKKKKNYLFYFFLSLISYFFKKLVLLKNFLYEVNFFKSTKVKSKIVSIGNIVAGGSGKTPFIILLLEALKEKNFEKNIAIITRGYKSKFENLNITIDQNSNYSAEEIGDEPFLLKKRIDFFFNKFKIFIGKNKLLSALKASSLNIDLALIDDGFQYRKLKKDLEVVILNGKNLFSDMNYLPKGLLRDDPKRLKKVDYIIVNNVCENFQKIENSIKKFSKSKIIYTNTYSMGFFDFSNKKIFLKENEKVALFCAIANPENFLNQIKTQKLKIVNFLYLLDHEKIKEENLNNFIDSSIEKKAKYIITTEKDFVKLNRRNYYKIPIIYLQISLKVTHNLSHFRSLIEKIHQIS